MAIDTPAKLRQVYPPPAPRAGLKVLDDRTLLLPDRPGNRQVDTLMNLVERPYVGLVFFVPGLTETLRVNGPVEEAFLHCAKALIRARLWEPYAHPRFTPPGRGI